VKAVGIGLAAALLALGASAESPPPILVVGDFLNPPFSSWSEEREPVGIEVEMLAMAGELLGRPVAWRELPFAEMLPAVEKGEAHVAASTIGVTEARSERLRFSESYHETELAIVVRAGDGEPATRAELEHATIGAGRATTSADAVRRELPAATLVVEKEGEMTFGEMLLAGRMAALVMDRPAARRLQLDHPGQLVILDEHLGVERYAFAVRPGETEILAAIDATVRRLRDEGRLRAWAAAHNHYE
jgi:polar amino acid transport system substrate-binding protein